MEVGTQLATIDNFRAVYRFWLFHNSLGRLLSLIKSKSNYNTPN